jgi:hypothetical protein
MHAPQQKAGEHGMRDVTNPALHPPNPNPGAGGTDLTPIGAAEKKSRCLQGNRIKRRRCSSESAKYALMLSAGTDNIIHGNLFFGSSCDLWIIIWEKFGGKTMREFRKRFWLSNVRNYSLWYSITQDTRKGIWKESSKFSFKLKPSIISVL